MQLRPFWILLGSGALLSLAFAAFHANPRQQTYTFDDPIDALSIGVPSDDIDLSVSANVDGHWTAWHDLVLEKEFDPLLRESDLVLFPKPVSSIRVRGTTRGYTVNPIRISHEPPSYTVAARLSPGVPRILSRDQWGADESLLYVGKQTSRSDEPTSSAEPVEQAPSQRVTDCEEAQRLYPNEFKTVRAMSQENGEQLRWPRRYSPDVKLLVVHHTAQEVNGDGRPGVERMRALYAYHATNRGWGDIGYNYIIDDDGQIYEGRSGGDGVVGGHVYCNNVGTIGVALMGNFEMEQPTQKQMQSLKWLLATLAAKYNIDLAGAVSYKGKQMPAVVGHKDLISTDCPGYYVRGAMAQIRGQLIAGNISGTVDFPTLASRSYVDRSEQRRLARLGSEVAQTVSSQRELVPVGSTTITHRPGGTVAVTLAYHAPKQVREGYRIASVERSNTRIGIWQERGGAQQRVRNDIVAPEMVRAGGTATIHLQFQLPREAGMYSVDIGDVTYTLQVEGRRLRTATPEEPTFQSVTAAERTNTQTPGYRRSTAQQTVARRTLSLQVPDSDSSTIRIRLGYQDAAAVIESAGRSVSLQNDAGRCSASENGRFIESGVVRIGMLDGTFTVHSWNTPLNGFRGLIECQVIDGALVLINEVSLEDYMKGLAEEPDSEPYEKQRAFAIAARSYAAHYLDPANRKFPGMPYDGDDSPARFQKYGGLAFERSNPAWVRAVEGTARLVLSKNGAIVKAAYFSTDDGRTRSPEENGWKDFPFIEVFSSKPDPWCRGLPLRGHGVGMSGCGARGQAIEGKIAEEILQYYYPGTRIVDVLTVGT